MRRMSSASKTPHHKVAANTVTPGPTKTSAPSPQPQQSSSPSSPSSYSSRLAAQHNAQDDANSSPLMSQQSVVGDDNNNDDVAKGLNTFFTNDSTFLNDKINLYKTWAVSGIEILSELNHSLADFVIDKKDIWLNAYQNRPGCPEVSRPSAQRWHNRAMAAARSAQSSSQEPPPPSPSLQPLVEDADTPAHLLIRSISQADDVYDNQKSALIELWSTQLVLGALQVKFSIKVGGC